MKSKNPAGSDAVTEPTRARAVLAAYRRVEQPPREVQARVWRRLQAPPKATTRGRGGLVWVALAAAAALTLWLSGALERRQAQRAGRDAAVGAQYESEPKTPGGDATRERDAARQRHADARAKADPPAIDEAHHAADVPAPDAPARDGGPLEPAPQAAASERAPGPVDGAGGRPRSHVRRDTSAKTSDRDDRAAPPMSTLAAERALLEPGWKASDAGRHADALAAAEAHAAQFPGGALVPEREALKAVSRCRRAPGERVALGDAFAAAYPRSPLLGRVRAACR